MNNNNINQLLINNINNNNQNIMNNNPTSSNIIHQILELNNQSIQLILEENIEAALEILSDAQILLNKHKSIITESKVSVIINHNTACCYQKQKNIEKCINYLQKVNNEFNIYLENKHKIQINTNFFLNKILTEQINSNVLLGDFILELRFCAKFHLQMCAAFSQNNNHIEALNHARLAALICEDDIVKTYFLFKQTKSEILKDTNNKKFSKIFYEKLIENEPIIISLYKTIIECSNNFKQGKNINKEIFTKEKIFSFISNKETKISTRNILGIIKNDDWLNLFNIGNIMFLYAMSYDDLDLDSDPKYELLRDAIIEKILMLTVAFFSIANELRFINNKNDNGAYYHSKSVEIACSFLPCTCPIVKHYVNTYCKYYGNGNLNIDLDKEFNSAGEINENVIDILKDPILFMGNDIINITDTKNVNVGANNNINVNNNLGLNGNKSESELTGPKTDRREKDSKFSLTGRSTNYINNNSNNNTVIHGSNNNHNSKKPKIREISGKSRKNNNEIYNFNAGNKNHKNSNYNYKKNFYQKDLFTYKKIMK